MRITAIILLAGCLQVSARGYSQEKVTLHLRNVSLEKAFDAVFNVTGYHYLGNSKSLSLYQHVTVDVKDATLDETLHKILEGTPLTYHLEDRFIILTQRPAVVPQHFMEDGQPPLTIHGKITDKNGKPLAGASVSLVGTNRGTSTDEAGNFSLDSVPVNGVLLISHVGYDAIEKRVKKGESIDIRLDQHVAVLNDVSVTYQTGYQSISRERATGSFTQPEKEMFDNRISPDVVSKLEGITSGLLFNRDATGNSSLLIRGLSTINASTAPLVVLDNFPYDGDLNSINPNDVESVTILKDAAAASIYGVRAGNGVIVITTKKGRINQPLRIDVTANYTVSGRPNLNYNRNFLDSKDFIGFEQTMFSQGYYANYFKKTYNIPVSPVVEMLEAEARGQLSAADVNALIASLSQIDIRNELSKYFYRGLGNQQYAISLTGGSDKSSYLMSIGYDKDLSNLVNNTNQRLTINSVATFRPIRNLEINGGITYLTGKTYANSIVNNLSSGGINNNAIYPYAQLADAQGNPLPVVRDFRDSFSVAQQANGFQNWLYYPLKEKNWSDNTTTTSDTRLRTDVKYSIIPGVSVEGLYTYETGTNYNRIIYSDSTYYTRNLINRYSATQNKKFSSYVIPPGGILNQTTSQYFSNNGRIQLDINQNFRNDVWALVGGFEVRQVKGTINTPTTMYGYDPNTDASSFVNFTTYYPTYPFGSNTIPYQFNLEHTLNRYRSYFLNTSYAIHGKYITSVSGRIDQTNLFGEKTNAKTIPLGSVGEKWNISREKFYRINWLPLLDVRATYGFNGNIINNGTAYTTELSANNGTLYFPPSFLQVSSPGNPSLTWERIKIANFGADFALLPKRTITGSIEYFIKRGVDLIGSEAVPSSTGFTTATLNYADMKGKGWDLSITSDNLRGRLQWTTQFILSYATDVVTNYKGDITTFIVPGKPVESLFAYKWAGLDPQTGDPMGYDTTGKVSKDYGQLTAETAGQDKYSGRTIPTTFGGLRNTFHYGPFTFSFNISYKFGYNFLRPSINYTNLITAWKGNVDYVNRWQAPGDEKKTNVPSIPTLPLDQTRDLFYAGSAALVTSGNHIRLQDVLIKYDLPIRKWKISTFKSLSVEAYGNNLGLLWKANKFGIDPDYQAANYVNPRTVSFSLKATL
ncbi:SusC/RagA family TonB-linked outer membrane protein [Dinghuibacter silviterrae]|nr:SusC/RagA family TonB-linked outer membrane protein [Dinghuibacter silviterrae]